MNLSKNQQISNKLFCKKTMIHKKLILLGCLVACYTASFAQEKIKYDSLILKKISEESCKCLKGRDLEKEDQRKEFEFCFGSIAFKYRQELGLYADKSDADFDDEISRILNRKVGAWVLPHLIRNCPVFLDMIVIQAQKAAEMMDKWDDESLIPKEDSSAIYADTTYMVDSMPPVEPPYDYNPDEFTVKGKLKAVESKGYTFIIIEDTKGQLHKLLWLHAFESDDKLIKNFKKYKGKNVSVQWYESNVYNAKTSSYQNFKEISWLEFIE
jgi:hypothetical protein